MTTGAIIQARMGASRLPGKVLLKIKNKPILQHIIERTSRANLIDKIAVATTINPEDSQIEMLCDSLHVNVYRGSEKNVLERFYLTAAQYEMDIIVRITADDPFKDPEIIDRAIQLILSENVDYVSNTIKPTYPEGIDVEVFRMSALEKAYQNAKLLSEKEHVTPFIWKNKKLFHCLNFEYGQGDLSHFRWTLDHEKDLAFISAVYDRLYKEDGYFGMEEIIKLIEKEPGLATLNTGTPRNEGYFKSLERDGDE